MSSQLYSLNITSKGSDALYVVTYKNGRFLRLEHKRGKLCTEQQWTHLMQVIPQIESEIDSVNTKLNSRGICYTQIVKESTGSLHNKFMDAYIRFYNNEEGCDPKLDGVSGKALKSIITYLRKVSASDAEAIDTWATILDNWSKLEPFFRKKKELKNINSNLNSIISQVKNGYGNHQAQSQANNYADGLRKSL